MKREELKKFLKVKGKVRGTVFQTDAQYVISEWGGRTGKTQKKIKRLGFKIPYQKARVMDWYPLGKRMISLLLIKETFDLKDE